MSAAVANANPEQTLSITQEEGTYHFRTTILVQERETDEVIDRLKAFHNGFMEKYSK